MLEGQGGADGEEVVLHLLMAWATGLIRELMVAILSDQPQIQQGAHGAPRSEDMTSDAQACGSDRKSTRLNSSHVRISYAVFCLKKKKKITKINIYEKKTQNI